MPVFFEKLDKIKPVYDAVYKIVLFICKILLVADILLTTYAVLGRYLHKYIPFITDPKWSEEVILTFMSYMAVLSASLAIRRNAHIRLSAFDRYLPEKLLYALDLISDIAVCAFSLIMLIVGWRYASKIGGRGFYISIPKLSKFWMYFPIPLAGIAMLIFEIEKIYSDIRAFFVPNSDKKEEA